jgi:DNA repair exonuclease SbcCD ATPase subunit
MTSVALLNNIASEEELGSGWKEISDLMDSVEQTLNQYATAASVKSIQVNLLKDRNKALSELLDKANEQANEIHAEQLRMKNEIEKQTKEIMSLAFIRSRMDELLEVLTPCSNSSDFQNQSSFFVIRMNKLPESKFKHMQSVWRS